MNFRFSIFHIILLPLISLSNIASSQESLAHYSDPAIPDSIPRVFAPGIISMEGIHEEGISFSPDGSELFFTSIKLDDEGEKNTSLYFSKLQDNNIWSKPAKPSFSSKANESEACFSNDGNSLYFFSERRKPGITPYIGEIWETTRTGNNWSRPRYHENILNETWISSISATSDATLYFSSYRNKKIGIYYSEPVNGKYSEPVFLPEEVNSIPGATNPFISSDENTLVFEGHTGGYGNPELYISFRTSRGYWTPAQKLNKSINKTGTETNPSLSPDGKYLFFTREGQIYWVKIEYIF